MTLIPERTSGKKTENLSARSSCQNFSSWTLNPTHFWVVHVQALTGPAASHLSFANRKTPGQEVRCNIVWL